jgi:hypothetical protein
MAAICSSFPAEIRNLCWVRTDLNGGFRLDAVFALQRIATVEISNAETRRESKKTGTGWSCRADEHAGIGRWW